MKANRSAGEELCRAVFAVQLLQIGLVVEQLQLTGRTGHVQKNDPFRPCGKVRSVRPLDQLRLDAQRRPLCVLGGKPQGTQSHAALLQEVPSRLVLQLAGVQLLEQIHFVSALSRFRIVLATMVSAANSAGWPTPASDDFSASRYSSSALA